jgi:hypothetical protein
MKTKIKGQFNGCTLTSKKPIIYGSTSNGLSIYADSSDVEKGFQLFKNYKLKVFEDGEEVPYYGFCYRTKIIRLPFFDFNQLPEWLRLQKLKNFFLNNEEIREVISNLEGIIPERLLKLSKFSRFPPPQV